MKRVFLFLLMAFLVIGIAHQAKAMPVDPVSFMVYDQPGLAGDGQITFAVMNFDFSGSFSAMLEFRVDDQGWQQISPNPAVMNIPGEQHRLTFRLVPGSGSPNTMPDLLLLGQDGIYYNGALMLWRDYLDLCSVVMGNKDKISPVPVPEAIWLFGSGLLGLIGLGRRYIK